MKRNRIQQIKTKLAKALVITMVASSFFSLAQVYAATDTAKSLSERYTVSDEDVTKVNDTKILFKDKEYIFDSPILNINSRVYIPLRSLSEVLNKEITWEGGDVKVATVISDDTILEVPIGSTKVVLNGNPVKIDDNGTRALIYNSKTYIPVRVVCESLGHEVIYKTQGDTKYILIDTEYIPTPELPNDSIWKDNKYNISIPAGFEETTYLGQYNYLRDEGLTEEQAKEVLSHSDPICLGDGSHKMTVQQEDMFFNKCNEYDKTVLYGGGAPLEKGEYKYQYKNGFYWDGYQWTTDESIYTCSSGLALR